MCPRKVGITCMSLPENVFPEKVQIHKYTWVPDEVSDSWYFEPFSPCFCNEEMASLVLLTSLLLQFFSLNHKFHCKNTVWTSKRIRHAIIHLRCDPYNVLLSSGGRWNILLRLLKLKTENSFKNYVTWDASSWRWNVTTLIFLAVLFITHKCTFTPDDENLLSLTCKIDIWRDNKSILPFISVGPYFTPVSFQHFFYTN